MGIELKTHKLLWGKSGNRCAICRIPLCESEIEIDNPSTIGNECHIVSRRIEGPRGHSTLTEEERDKENNLILLCCNDHKIIDDKVNEYTVEKLHEIKANHEDWVRKTLDFHIDKSVLGICNTIDHIEKIFEIRNWTNVFSGITYSSDPSLSKTYYDKLIEGNDYLFKRFKITEYADIEEEIDNFRMISHDLINVFSKHMEYDFPNTAYYITRRFYKIQEWDEKKYNFLLNKYNFHIDLLHDLVILLTGSANRMIDLIRKHLNMSYMQENGRLMLHFGLDMNLQEKKLIVVNEQYIKYEGIESIYNEKDEEYKLHMTKTFIDDYK